jgi:hypothetical protein
MLNRCEQATSVKYQAQATQAGSSMRAPLQAEKSCCEVFLSEMAASDPPHVRFPAVPRPSPADKSRCEVAYLSTGIYEATGVQLEFRKSGALSSQLRGDGVALQARLQ